MHEQMVRLASARMLGGHDPLTSWFPYLGLGSPQFMHYQSTPAILTGLAGLLAGPDTAFRWSLYLLWCLWPVAIYCSARVFGLSRAAAALAGTVSPLLNSLTGIGYERHAYMFVGFGVWTQLWGSWALPFAWALTWRAIADKRFIAPAAALVALTAALHYETGYLAFLAIGIMPWLITSGIRARLARAAALLAAALLASAWVWYPLVRYARWAAVNQALASGPSASGYGALTTLRWVVTARLLDNGHLPVISLLAVTGLAVTAWRWRRAGIAKADGYRADPGRAIVAMFCAALVLSFGRTTFGEFAHIIPGSADLFFRRFLMGAQLAAIYLAGIGTEAIATRAVRRARLSWLPVIALTLAGVAYLAPAWLYLHSLDARNSADIQLQLRAQSADQSLTAPVIEYIRTHDRGRVYAGSPDNWGVFSTVGLSPMYEYLDGADLDEIGYSLRTASLMSQPEQLFDPANPGDYALFGIRYVVLPGGMRVGTTGPPRGAILVVRNSLFRLFKLPGNSYFRVGDTVGSIAADRADIGSATLAYLRSERPGQDLDLTVGYAGARAAPPTAGRASPPSGPVGSVLSARADLVNGQASATVRLRRRAVVVLSASFDPGWSVTVDGRPAATQMVAPAMVAVGVPPGVHRVTFRYHGFGGYPELLSLGAADLLAITLLGRRSCGRRLDRRWSASDEVLKIGMTAQSSLAVSSLQQLLNTQNNGSVSARKSARRVS